MEGRGRIKGIDLKTIRVYMLFKTMRLHEVSKEISMEKDEEELSMTKPVRKGENQKCDALEAN